MALEGFTKWDCHAMLLLDFFMAEMNRREKRMNIDKNKLLKSLLTLAALFIFVFAMTQFMRRNSMSLTEYAAQNPEIANQEESESAENDAVTEENTDAAASDTDGELLTEILHEEAENTSTSALTGAILNGDAMEEQRISYTDSFYYEPLSDNLKRYITGVSFPSVSDEEELAITYEELRYVHILHYDFDGNLAEGELICNEYIAQDLVEIFYELYRNEYQLEKVHLIDEYDGDDTASMEDNNTSCFNYRLVEGSSSLSRHALGLAIDVNPLYNPYITYEENGSERISPASASAYADRTVNFPYKIDENDLCYKLFMKHGFTWGGNWNSSKDYQHFQKVMP